MTVIYFFSRFSKKIPNICRWIIYYVLLYLYPIKRGIGKDGMEILARYKENVGKSCLANNIISEIPSYDLLIIVPVYNVEKYLAACIDSIVNQETHYSFYVVAVNDGSTDGSSDILKSYQFLPNFRIINRKNEGQSGARNAALKNVDANYVMFVDSDDILAQGAIERLLSFAYNTNVDIVQGGHDTFGHNVRKTNYTQKEGFYKPQRLYGFPWGKVYKKELWRNIRFPEKYLYEDTLNRLIVFNLAKSAYICDDIVYHYRINRCGITKSTVGSYKLLDTVWISLQLYNDAKQMNLLSSTFSEVFINQLMFNYVRTISLKNANIDRAIFDVYRKMIDLAKLNEPESKIACRALSYLKNNSFKKFYLLSLIIK